MGQLEKIDCRASESLVFGGLMDKTYESLKKCNFNCRRATKIVDISHRGTTPLGILWVYSIFLQKTTIKFPKGAF